LYGTWKRTFPAIALTSSPYRVLFPSHPNPFNCESIYYLYLLKTHPNNSEIVLEYQALGEVLISIFL
jgi:hypothetical protein